MIKWKKIIQQLYRITNEQHTNFRFRILATAPDRLYFEFIIKSATNKKIK